LNLGQIMKEGDNVIYEIQLTKSVIDCNALVMLLGWKRSDIKRLHIMGKVSKERNNNNLVIERNECKLRCLVRTIVIVKEENLFVRIKASTWVFNKVFKLFDNKGVIDKTSKR
jgi:MinD superfamily P-loop ATPase